MAVMQARFEGGPFDGLALHLVGRSPSYLMLMRAPPGVAMDPIVVGADFDDDWPGQQRYERASEEPGLVVYRHEAGEGVEDRTL